MKYDNFDFSDWVDLIAEATVLHQGILSEEAEKAYSKYLEENAYKPVDDEDYESLGMDIDEAVEVTILDIAENQKNHPDWKEYNEYAEILMKVKNNPEEYGFCDN
ncbi:hypothetical protein CBE01nite_41100 [Clostridium beijerinckii]|uniref:Phage protein n=1 Tax=Clostridium beijerinckii TaxID=1520 RepID=A0AB74VF86_CLOBE|nr:hypothetical protein [Clostridium beijerinckii]NRZ29429.1 hypothetical protein [Clostridium beijerinckii]NYB94801.1 hypothetical protein [Clostridium beijerinckii]OOM28037.1 hypothetical protein CLBEI_00130 [Clostridium beijerinckii]QUN35062.1 hypothetical protein KEC93_24605 [Clostridium beijerinckii]SQA99949.1 Uncharacterised protein [Clostridium beijerinckii]